MSDATDRTVLIDTALGRLITLYGEPKTVDKIAWYVEYKRAFNRYADDVLAPMLEAGISEVIATHPMRSWPTVGDCVKAFRRIEPDVLSKCRAAAPPRQPSELKWHQPTPEAKARVNGLVQGLKASMLERTAEAGLKPRRIPTDRRVFDARREAHEQRVAEARGNGNGRGEDW